MILYWRIKEELKYLGEDLVFHDPSLIREYRIWTEKHGMALGLIHSESRRSVFSCGAGPFMHPCLN